MDDDGIINGLYPSQARLILKIAKKEIFKYRTYFLNFDLYDLRMPFNVKKIQIDMNMNTIISIHISLS